MRKGTVGIRTFLFVSLIVCIALLNMGVWKGCNPWAKDKDRSTGSSGLGPFNLSAEAVSHIQINLTWTHQPERDPYGPNYWSGFEIQRKTGAEGIYQTITTTTLGLVTSYQDTGLNPNTTYYYRIRAYHTVGWGKTQYSYWSNEVWATTPSPSNIWTATTTTNVPDARNVHTAIWTGQEMIIWGGDADGGIHFNDGAKYYPITDTWVSITTTNAPSPRKYHPAVWTGQEMIIWGGFGYGPPTFIYNTGAKYYPITDTWVSITTNNAPVSRYGHTAVWTGTEMIIWGGWDDNLLNTGAKYYPISDTWVSITTDNAPVSRYFHSAVWTGNEMIVWGGWGQSSELNSGAKYYPITDTWVSITATDAPISRAAHTAIWTGSEMLIWGGQDISSNFTNTGARYNPSTDTWTPITTDGAPSGREFHTAVWTGTEMIIWGGDDSSICFNTGGRYNPSTDTWSLIPTDSVPSARDCHTAIWTGTEMIIWGGYDTVLGFLNTGGRYKP